MNEIKLIFGEDGKASLYDDTYDITIHCESKEEQEKVEKVLQNTQRWIPCSERLPEEDGEYLCTYGALSGCSGWFVGIESYDAKLQQFGFYTDDGHGRDVWHHVRNVVAWMPLPTPWKEEKE